MHRFSHNFTALANYTFSHCLNEGDVSGDLTGPQYQDPSNRRGSRGNCGYDRRHIFNNSVVMTSPHFSSHVTQLLAGNWQLSGILSVQSGAFWTVTSGRDNSLTGVNLDRPDLVGNYALSQRTFAQWFDTNAFKANTPGSFGNAGRGIVLGPKTINTDIGLMRQFPVHESIKLEFRAEAFNVINHANLDTTSTSSFHLSLSDPKIGQITGAADPRILQFALKLFF